MLSRRSATVFLICSVIFLASHSIAFAQEANASCPDPDETNKYNSTKPPYPATYKDTLRGVEVTITNLYGKSCLENCPAGSKSKTIKGVCKSADVCKATLTCEKVPPKLPDVPNGPTEKPTETPKTPEKPAATDKPSDADLAKSKGESPNADTKDDEKDTTKKTDTKPFKSMLDSALDADKNALWNPTPIADQKTELSNSTKDVGKALESAAENDKSVYEKIKDEVKSLFKAEPTSQQVPVFEQSSVEENLKPTPVKTQTVVDSNVDEVPQISNGPTGFNEPPTFEKVDTLGTPVAESKPTSQSVGEWLGEGLGKIGDTTSEIAQKVRDAASSAGDAASEAIAKIANNLGIETPEPIQTTGEELTKQIANDTPQLAKDNNVGIDLPGAPQKSGEDLTKEIADQNAADEKKAQGDNNLGLDLPEPPKETGKQITDKIIDENAQDEAKKILDERAQQKADAEKAADPCGDILSWACAAHVASLLNPIQPAEAGPRDFCTFDWCTPKAKLAELGRKADQLAINDGVTPERMSEILKHPEDAVKYMGAFYRAAVADKSMPQDIFPDEKAWMSNILGKCMRESNGCSYTDETGEEKARSPLQVAEETAKLLGTKPDPSKPFSSEYLKAAMLADLENARTAGIRLGADASQQQKVGLINALYNGGQSRGPNEITDAGYKNPLYRNDPGYGAETRAATAQFNSMMNRSEPVTPSEVAKINPRYLQGAGGEVMSQYVNAAQALYPIEPPKFNPAGYTPALVNQPFTSSQSPNDTYGFLDYRQPLVAWNPDPVGNLNSYLPPLASPIQEGENFGLQDRLAQADREFALENNVQTPPPVQNNNLTQEIMASNWAEVAKDLTGLQPLSDNSNPGMADRLLANVEAKNDINQTLFGSLNGGHPNEWLTPEDVAGMKFHQEDRSAAADREFALERNVPVPDAIVQQDLTRQILAENAQQHPDNQPTSAGDRLASAFNDARQTNTGVFNDRIAISLPEPSLNPDLTSFIQSENPTPIEPHPVTPVTSEPLAPIAEPNPDLHQTILGDLNAGEAQPFARNEIPQPQQVSDLQKTLFGDLNIGQPAPFDSTVTPQPIEEQLTKNLTQVPPDVPTGQQITDNLAVKSSKVGDALVDESDIRSELKQMLQREPAPEDIVNYRYGFNAADQEKAAQIIKDVGTPEQTMERYIQAQKDLLNAQRTGQSTDKIAALQYAVDLAKIDQDFSAEVMANQMAYIATRQEWEQRYDSGDFSPFGWIPHENVLPPEMIPTDEEKKYMRDTVSELRLSQLQERITATQIDITSLNRNSWALPSPEQIMEQIQTANESQDHLQQTLFGNLGGGTPQALAPLNEPIPVAGLVTNKQGEDWILNDRLAQADQELRLEDHIPLPSPVTNNDLTSLIRDDNARQLSPVESQPVVPVESSPLPPPENQKLEDTHVASKEPAATPPPFVPGGFGLGTFNAFTTGRADGIGDLKGNIGFSSGSLESGLPTLSPSIAQLYPVPITPTSPAVPEPSTAVAPVPVAQNPELNRTLFSDLGAPAQPFTPGDMSNIAFQNPLQSFQPTQPTETSSISPTPAPIPVTEFSQTQSGENVRPLAVPDQPAGSPALTPTQQAQAEAREPMNFDKVFKDPLTRMTESQAGAAPNGSSAPTAVPAFAQLTPVAPVMPAIPAAPAPAVQPTPNAAPAAEIPTPAANPAAPNTASPATPPPGSAPVAGPQNPPVMTLPDAAKAAPAAGSNPTPEQKPEEKSFFGKIVSGAKQALGLEAPAQAPAPTKTDTTTTGGTAQPAPAPTDVKPPANAPTPAAAQEKPESKPGTTPAAQKPPTPAPQIGPAKTGGTQTPTPRTPSGGQQQSSASSNNQGFFSGALSFLGGFFGGIMNSILNKPPKAQQPVPNNPVPVTPVQPMVSGVAGSPVVPKGGSTTITWNASGVDNCFVTKPGGEIIANGAQNGTAGTGTLLATTVFQVQCNGQQGGSVSVPVQVTVQ
jgi:hypothetical protein